MYWDPNPAVGFAFIFIIGGVGITAAFIVVGMYVAALIAAAVFAALISVTVRAAIAQHRWIMETFHSDRNPD